MGDSATTGTGKKIRKKNEVVDTIVVIIEALLIALVFRTFLFQPFSIPTSSMQSTLMIGDYFVANKFTWGLGKYSFPFPVPISDRLGQFNQPQQGDVAVFFNEPTRQDYIKRIVGMPGDRVQMKDGRLYINGEMLDRRQIATGVDRDSSGGEVAVTLYEETLPNGVVHTIQEISDQEYFDNTQEFVVPTGHYFMMGDNRDRSADSRVLRDVGYVPAINLIGKAEARFFSIRDNIAPWQVWQWPANVRWDRMFQWVTTPVTHTPS
jgi:signal peptidase I